MIEKKTLVCNSKQCKGAETPHEKAPGGWWICTLCGGNPLVDVIIDSKTKKRWW